MADRTIVGFISFIRRESDFAYSYHRADKWHEPSQKSGHPGESPYVDRRNPEDVDEPAFVKEWQEADDSVMVIGHWCLCMVQASLHAYLRECISPLGWYWGNPEELRSELSAKKAKSWFERYRLLFLDLGINWEKAPVSILDLEQLNLTRDDLIHNIDMMSFNVERVETHAERFPAGLFVDDLWQGLGMERLKVDKGKLELAIQLVRSCCAWLDDIRCRYPEYVEQVPSNKREQQR